ncbi:MAG: hypothetical protein E7587_09610 [Ruminococcaceae bacterium]|nr:hypothetical protein [Oscillospiraceae bacterium]
MTKIIKSKVLISALFIALLCVLLSVAIALPTSAEELTPTASGSCGNNATWEYYESTGELKILGSGEMTTFDTSLRVPWYSYRSKIKTIIIADEITSIGNYAFFECFSLASIEIPSSVTSIGYSAFERCSLLTNIEIPFSVTNIANRAFAGCSSLETFTVEEGNTKYHSEGNCLIETNSKALIAGCKNSIIPTDGSVTSIRHAAFERCYSLTEIEIPSSVTNIGNRAFAGCRSLESLTVEEGNTVYHSKNNCIIDTSTKTLIAGCKNSIIPSDGSVTSLGTNALAWCYGLTSVEIPSSVTSFGRNAFYASTNLKSITVDSNNPNFMSIDGNLYSKDGTVLIQYATGKTETSFEIPHGVKTVGCGAFLCNRSLDTIIIPDSVISIDQDAFRETLITSIAIPNGVTSIGNYEFAYCRGLTNVEFPSSVTSIGNYVFLNCSSLTRLTLLSETPATLGSSALSGSAIEAIYVPASAVDSYKSHADWAEYKEMIFPLEAKKATISFGEYKVKTGKTVSVTVSLENNPGIAIASITLNYDKTVLTLKEVENGEIFDTLDTGVNLLWSADENCEGNGVLATLTFEVNENAEAKDYTISAVVNEAYNEDSEKVDILVSDGKITTYKFIYGDANDDDVISALDVLLLRKYVANYDYTTGISTVSVGLGADANGDGNVTALDVLLMRKYMANYDYDTGTSSIVLGPKS